MRNEEGLKIKDDSGDRDFFTIIPNYIINHSTANDRALYLEMKRFAGEDGKCFATEKTMMFRLKIGKKAFNKSLKYLINSGWVSFMGLTEGKTRPIKTYKINNIWKENSDYYKKISSESTLSIEGEISAESRGDKCQKQHKISAESNVEEDPSLRRSIKKKRVKNKIFHPPSLEEITTYCLERNNGISPQHFINFYTSKGWMIGKNRMKDWKAAVRTWEGRSKSSNKLKAPAGKYENFK